MHAPTQNSPSDNLSLVGSLTTLVAVGLPVAAILTAGARDVEVQPGIGDWVFVAFVAAFTIATFALLVPWCLRGGPRRTSRSAIGLSTSALVISTVLFWTMVPVALGTAGGYLAVRDHQGTGASRPGGSTLAAIVLGGVAALGSVAAYVATS